MKLVGKKGMIFKYLVFKPKKFKFYKKYNVTVGLKKCYGFQVFVR